MNEDKGKIIFKYKSRGGEYPLGDIRLVLNIRFSER